MKKLLLSLSCLLLTLEASSLSSSRETLHLELLPAKVKIVEEKEFSDTSQAFIALSIGISMFDVKEENIVGNIPLDIYPRDAGNSYGVGVGYYLTEYLFTTINYQRTELKDIHFDNLFMTFNYQLNKELFSPYFGVVAGYDTMSWDNFPITTTISQPSSSGFAGGFQIGGDTPIARGLKFYIFYRYLWINNKTIIKISPDEKEITHNSEQNLNLGLKFTF